MAAGRAAPEQQQIVPLQSSITVVVGPTRPMTWTTGRPTRFLMAIVMAPRHAYSYPYGYYYQGWN